MSSEAPAPGAIKTSEDEQILHKLGYAQELFRAMGGFQNFAISFTIISILAGCLTSYYIAFESGGPIAVTWGWLLVGLMATIVALAMAEIASSFPTAGGLYYWASKLGSPGWGWATGWFNLIGQIAVTAAIGYGLATFATVLFDDLFSFEKHMNDWFGFNYNETVYALYAVLLLAVCLINVFDVRITAFLNTFSAYWHMIGVAFIVIVLIVVPNHHQSASYVFTGTVNATGYGGNVTGFSHLIFWFVFGLGLLMSQYTMTGFDASAHMAEETHQASRMAAVGMYMSVVVSAIFGFVLLVAVTFAIPSTQGALDNIGAVVPWIWRESMSENWSDALLAICVVAQFFCLTASTTSASRMMFAFSRDGAVPGHTVLAARLQAPCARPRSVRDRRPLRAADGAGDLELPGRLRGRDGDRGDRPLHRVHPARLPPAPARRQVRARRVEPRPPLQVDRLDRDRLGGDRHGPVLHAAVLRRAAVVGQLPVDAHELHGALVRRASASASAAGGCCRPTSGSRARCGWAPRKSSSCWRRSRRTSSCFRPTPATRRRSPLPRAALPDDGGAALGDPP